MSSANTLIHRDQGGAVETVEAGGLLTIAGTINITGTLKKDGADITAVLPLTVHSVVLLAELNAGKEIIAAVTGRQIKVLGYYLRVNGSSAATGTSVKLQDGAVSPVVLVTALTAALTSGVEISSENTVSNVTKGAGFLTPLTVSKALNIANVGTAMTGLTSIDVVVRYTLV